MVELYLHSHIRRHDLILDYLRTVTKLHLTYMYFKHYEAPTLAQILT
jgi:hypothetical protein